MTSSPAQSGPFPREWLGLAEPLAPATCTCQSASGDKNTDSSVLSDLYQLLKDTQKPSRHLGKCTGVFAAIWTVRVEPYSRA